MSLQLKVKAVSLSKEAAYIKRLEKRLQRNRDKLRTEKVKNVPNTNEKWNKEYPETARISRELPKEKEAYDLQHKADFVALQLHRIEIVRVATRHTNLARAFIAGRPYQATAGINGVETPPKRQPTRKECNTFLKRTAPVPVAKMVRQYGGPNFSNVTEDQISTWIGNW